MSIRLVSTTLPWPFRQQSRRGRPVLISGEVAALSNDAQGVASPAIPEGIGGEVDEGLDRHGAVLRGGPATSTTFFYLTAWTLASSEHHTCRAKTRLAVNVSVAMGPKTGKALFTKW